MQSCEKRFRANVVFVTSARAVVELCDEDGTPASIERIHIAPRPAESFVAQRARLYELAVETAESRAKARGGRLERVTKT